MELVAQHDLPEPVQSVPGIRFTQQLFSHHRVPFQVLQCELSLPVPALVSGHGGIGAPVIFQIQLPFPCRQKAVPGNILFQFFKKLTGMRLMCPRTARDTLFHPAAVFQHLLGGSASAVSVTVYHQRFGLKFFLSVPFPVPLHLRRVEQGIVCRVVFCYETAFHRRRIVVSAGGKMCQDLRPVDPAPDKRVAGHPVELVPADLGRHEIVESAFLHDLRQRGRITEYIREPQDPVLFPEFLLKEAESVDQLAYKGFTGGDVAVCFHPHAAFRFPSSLRDPRFDLFVNLRGVLLHVIVELGLAGHEFVFRISFHQFQDRGKTPDRLIPRCPECPQPGTVDMGMPYAGDHFGGRRTDLFIESFRDAALGFLQALKESGRIFLPQIQPVQGIRDRLNDPDVFCAVRRQKPGGLIGEADIIIILFDFGFLCLDLRIEKKVKVLITGEGREQDLEALPRSGTFREQDRPVVHIQPLPGYSVHISHELGIDRIPLSFSSRTQFIEDPFPGIFRRYDNCGPEIKALPVPAPDFFTGYGPPV